MTSRKCPKCSRKFANTKAGFLSYQKHFYSKHYTSKSKTAKKKTGNWPALKPPKK